MHVRKIHKIHRRIRSGRVRACAYFRSSLVHRARATAVTYFELSGRLEPPRGLPWATMTNTLLSLSFPPLSPTHRIPLLSFSFLRVYLFILSLSLLALRSSSSLPLSPSSSAIRAVPLSFSGFSLPSFPIIAPLYLSFLYIFLPLSSERACSRVIYPVLSPIQWLSFSLARLQHEQCICAVLPTPLRTRLFSAPLVLSSPRRRRAPLDLSQSLYCTRPRARERRLNSGAYLSFRTLERVKSFNVGTFSLPVPYTSNKVPT